MGKMVPIQSIQQNKSSGLRRLSDSPRTPGALAGPIQAKPDCESCRGYGWVLVDGQGARRCECLSEVIQARQLARIPAIYQALRLETVRGDGKRHQLQADIFDTMRAEPEASFILSGRNGCGKSLAGWLLYRRAVESNRPALGILCADLLDEFRQWELNAEKLPSLQPGDLKSTTRHLIFLDEIDKARPTEFSGEMLFRLLDAAYSHDHQLIVAVNKPLTELSAHWSRTNSTYGPSIVRRLVEMTNGYLIEMF